ncbi:MAG: hypothetical protein HQL69_17625 [Magnetococcales bacterium]|nr:hypothetical protein [Magnetococcales bacterium]
MSGIDTPASLYEHMVEIWGRLVGDSTFFLREELTKKDNPKAWEKDLKSLRSPLADYLESEFSDLASANTAFNSISQRYSPLLLLAGLDRALYSYRVTEVGSRSCYEFPFNNTLWHILFRQQASVETVHKQQDGHPLNYLLYHRIFKMEYSGVLINMSENCSHLNRQLREFIENEETYLRVYLGTFQDGVGPDWGGMKDKKCITSGFSDPLPCPDSDNKTKKGSMSGAKRREMSIISCLKEASKQKSHVVVMPELSVSPEQRAVISRWLETNEHQFFMVVAGSFHEIDQNINAEIPVNRAVVFDGRGWELFAHDKILAFGTSVCSEIIYPGTAITLLETPFGVFSLAICRDYLEEDQKTQLPWQDLSPDWMLVPSMSSLSGLNAHKRQTKTMANLCGTRSFIPNQCFDGTYEDNQHGFVYCDFVDKTENEQSEKCRNITPEQRIFSIPVID